jgi:hypothetical protein
LSTTALISLGALAPIGSAAASTTASGAGTAGTAASAAATQIRDLTLPAQTRTNTANTLESGLARVAAKSPPPTQPATGTTWQAIASFPNEIQDSVAGFGQVGTCAQAVAETLPGFSTP